MEHRRQLLEDLSCRVTRSKLGTREMSQCGMVKYESIFRTHQAFYPTQRPREWGAGEEVGFIAKACDKGGVQRRRRPEWVINIGIRTVPGSRWLPLYQPNSTEILKLNVSPQGFLTFQISFYNWEFKLSGTRTRILNICIFPSHFVI